MEKRETLSCSFCGKSQKEVKKLIAGPTVYICDECIGLCNDIIAEEIAGEEKREQKLRVPRPSEIKTILDEYVVGQDARRHQLGRVDGHLVVSARRPHSGDAGGCRGGSKDQALATVDDHVLSFGAPCEGRPTPPRWMRAQYTPPYWRQEGLKGASHQEPVNIRASAR